MAVIAIFMQHLFTSLFLLTVTDLIKNVFGSINKICSSFSPSVLCIFSNDEDEELHSTDPESKEKNKDKKTLCKVKWSRDEVSLSEAQVRSGLPVGCLSELNVDSILHEMRI